MIKMSNPVLFTMAWPVLSMDVLPMDPETDLLIGDACWFYWSNFSCWYKANGMVLSIMLLDLILLNFDNLLSIGFIFP